MKKRFRLECELQVFKKGAFMRVISVGPGFPSAVAVSQKYLHVEMIQMREVILQTYGLDGRFVRAWQKRDMGCRGLAVVQSLVFVLDVEGLHAFDEEGHLQFSVDIITEIPVTHFNPLVALSNEIAVVDYTICVFALDGTWLRECHPMQLLRSLHTDMAPYYVCSTRKGDIFVVNMAGWTRVTADLTPHEISPWKQDFWARWRHQLCEMACAQESGVQ
jgi:hypothetical protein